MANRPPIPDIYSRRPTYKPVPPPQIRSTRVPRPKLPDRRSQPPRAYAEPPRRYLPVPDLNPTARVYAGPSTIEPPRPVLNRPRPVLTRPRPGLTRPRPVLTRPRKTKPSTPKPPPPLPRINPVPEPIVDEPIEDIDSPETLIRDIIREQDSDKEEEKEYLDLVEYLLGKESKYDIFSRLFPDHTCRSILIIMNSEFETPDVEPSIPALQECIRSKEEDGISVAIYLAIGRHANMIWFDTQNKIINRYDPQTPVDSIGQSEADSILREFLKIMFPDYVYLGNSLELYQCVQSVRGRGRLYTSDYFCQDYSLLYIINRINGMSHELAALDLVTRGDDILEDLTELLRALTYRIRLEKGLNIPERFVDWSPPVRKND